MKVYEFTLPQIEYYRTFCNFDEKEAEVFELRRKTYPLNAVQKFSNMMI